MVWVPPPGSSVREVEGRGSAIIRVSPVTANEAGTFTCYIYTDLGPQEKTIEIIGTSIIAIIIIIISQKCSCMVPTDDLHASHWALTGNTYVSLLAYLLAV